MLLKAVIKSCCEKKNNIFSTQWSRGKWAIEVTVQLWKCKSVELQLKKSKKMLTARAVIFEGLRMKRTKQLVDDCLKITPLDKSLLKMIFDKTS